VVFRKYIIVGGSLGLLLTILIFGFTGDRLPRYRSEMLAVKAITTIQTAETQYYVQFGRYAVSLAQLGPTGANLIDRDLATGHKGGFEFGLWLTQAGYAISARPIPFGANGIHTYYSDQSMDIHQHNGQEPATVVDPLLGDPVRRSPGRA
jgi:type IV pilus assembly protein PilA